MLGVVATVLLASSARAQDSAATGCQLPAERVTALLPVPENRALDAGSEEEDNLRVRQLLGCAPVFPLSIRALSRAEVAGLFPAESAPATGIRLHPARASLWFNSSRPLSEAQRGVWVGKGVTLAATGGLELKRSMLSASFRPWGFVAQNSSFVPNMPARQDFLNPFYPYTIDYPYRFGDRAYARLDPGESWIRADYRHVAAGVSSAAQAWGPARLNPLLLGSSAGGFPHAFIEATALDLRIMKVSLRSMAGRLSPSPEFPSDSARLLTGAAFVLAPTFLPGLEIGGARVFHTRWPVNGGWGKLLSQPLQSFLKEQLHQNLETEEASNQLASAFARLVLPVARLELYGEFLRDDHSWDMRDFLAEPEHASAYLLGGRRAWNFANGDGFAATVEIVNGRNPTDLRFGRLETPLFVHGGITEGHTLRGLPLGAPDVFGGGGTTVVVDRYESDRRTSITWRNHRTGYHEAGGTWSGQWYGDQELQMAHTRRGATTDWTVGALALSDWDRNSLFRGSVGVSVSAAWHGWKH